MEQEKIQVLHDTEDDPVSNPHDDHRSTIDTSRPFRSVKEAVAVFGERFLVGEIYSPTTNFSFPKKETPIFSPSTPRKYSSSNDGTRYISTGMMYSSPSPRGSSYSHDVTLSDAVKKLEVELEETKTELKLLKERETETEVALASLNAELHKNMSKLASAEAGSKAIEASLRSGSGRGRDVDIINLKEEEKKRDHGGYIRSYSPSLAEILCVGENEGLFVGRKKERKLLVRKKKPIIPLVGDLFSWKKGSSTTPHNPLFASSHLQWN